MRQLNKIQAVVSITGLNVNLVTDVYIGCSQGADERVCLQWLAKRICLPLGVNKNCEFSSVNTTAYSFKSRVEFSAKLVCCQFRFASLGNSLNRVPNLNMIGALIGTLLRLLTPSRLNGLRL